MDICCLKSNGNGNFNMYGTKWKQITYEIQIHNALCSLNKFFTFQSNVCNVPLRFNILFIPNQSQALNGRYNILYITAVIMYELNVLFIYMTFAPKLR